MRSKYCIKYELGLCPVHQGAKQTGDLFLVNNSRRFPLLFDCKACEMAVLEEL
jgi:putative protease